MEAVPLVRRVVEDTRALDAGDTQRVGEAMMYAQAAMPEEASDAARRMDDIAARVESVSMPLTLRNELTKAYAAAYSGNSERVRQLTQGVRAHTGVPNTARIESTVIDTLDAHWYDRRSRARELAVRLAEDVEASALPANRRAQYLSVAASALLAANDLENAQRVLALAADNYGKTGMTASVLMSGFINARAQLGLARGNTTVRDDLQTLVNAWQKVYPNSQWHGESLYWLSRVQEASGEAEAAARTRRQAADILKSSKLPALRRLAAQ